MKNFMTFLLTATVSASGSGARVENFDPGKPTIILVHGLWADGSCWSKIIPDLIDKGFKVIAVQNPTTSIEDDVAATQRAIEVAGGDVILVGHSWGGFVISEAGNNPHVKALVYVAAFAPDKDESIPSLFEKAPATQLSSYFQATGDFITLTKDGVTKAFADDLTPKEQDMVFAVQQPASQNTFKAVGKNAAWKQKPSWYIVASQDKTIHPDLERLMAKRANAKTTTVPTSHVPMLSQPDKVLSVIYDAANEVSKK